MSANPVRQFVKNFHKEAIEFQVAKETQLAHIFSGSDTVRVPELLRFNREEAQLTFEFIEGLVSFRSLLKDRSLAIELANRVGRGIATAHQRLDFPETAKKRLPDPYGRFESENAFLHLDLSTVNVQYKPSTDCVYLIDWEASPLLKSDANFGSVYFDLCFFISNLFMIEPYIFTNRKAKRALSLAFLEGYQSVYGKLNIGEFEKVAMAHFHNRGRLDSRLLKRVVCWRNHAQYKSFITCLRTILA